MSNPNEPVVPVDTSNEEVGKQEIIRLLGEDDTDEAPIVIKEKRETEEKDDEGEEKLEVKEESDDLKELEDELEEVDPEKLELTTPVRRKEILAKYPKLFKDFPYLEKAYYREQQFTEIVPTIEDAKTAVSKAEVLDKFEADISRGNLEQALRAVKQSGDDAFFNLVDNYLPYLAKIDKDAYHHVIGNIVRATVSGMIKDAKDSGNEDLEAAAKILNHYVFATNQITGPTNLTIPKTGNEKDPNEELNREKQDFLRQKFESARDDLNVKVTNVLKATIEGNIDPKESMSEYVRKNASRECQESLDKLLMGDKRLAVIIDKLWEQAFRENLSKASLDKIRSAYLSRAKTLLPTVIKQARNEALKGIGKRVTDNEDDSPKKGPLPAGRTASSSSSSGKSEKEKAKSIPANMSSREYLMKD